MMVLTGGFINAFRDGPPGSTQARRWLKFGPDGYLYATPDLTVGIGLT